MAYRGSIIVNLMTLGILSCMCLVGSVLAVLLANPYVPFNPYPPPTLPAVAVLPSPTATTTVSLFPTLPPTWTATSRASATPTVTLIPTETPSTPATEATETPSTTVTPGDSPTPDQTQIFQATQGMITDTPAATATRTATPTASRTRSAFLFTVQDGTPLATKNIANPNGCNWMGVAGQAFDLNGNPIIGFLVHVEGGGLNIDAVTGSNRAYGDGGFEVTLNDHAVQTTGEYIVQLRDTSGRPLSNQVPLNTFADCNKNLILLNFVQNH